MTNDKLRMTTNSYKEKLSEATQQYLKLTKQYNQISFLRLAEMLLIIWSVYKTYKSSISSNGAILYAYYCGFPSFDSKTQENKCVASESFSLYEFVVIRNLSFVIIIESNRSVC